MRLSKLVLLAGAVIAATAVPAPAAAAPPYCDIGRYCSAKAYENIHDNITAISANLAVGCLYAPEQSVQEVSWSTWFSTRADLPNRNYVEAGIKVGALRSGVTGFRWYWADTYTGNGTFNYFEHFIDWATTGTYKNVSFYWIPNGNGVDGWGVYRDGILRGWSGAGAYPANPHISADSADGNVILDGYAQDWRYRNKANQWQHVGGSMAFSGAAFSGSRPGVGQVRAWTHWWDCNGNHPGGASAGASTTSRAVGSDTAALMQDPSGVRQNLRAKVDQTAAGLSSANAGGARFVKSTRGAAMARHNGTEVTDNQSVYVVQTTGAFSRPGKNGQMIKGSILEVVVDATTGEVTDWGITDGGAHSFAALGPVQALD